MKNEEVLSLFRQAGALLEGHFQLTSGLHSPHYFQCAKVLQFPQFATKLCGGIADHFRDRQIDVVIAPALGGIVVGQEVGRQLNVRTMFAERKDGAMQLRRGFEIRSGERVLVCEDVVTTGGSVIEVTDIVRSSGGAIAGVGYVVDRSGGKARFELSGDVLLFALLRMDVVTYQPDACPLCKQNSPVQRPGSRNQ
jgi:orotate phosphoribosyltransferase